MTYDEIIAQLLTMLEIPVNQSDDNFQRMVPEMFAYADNRIYRELDFLATLNATMAALSANTREAALPSTVINLRMINVITPVGAISNTSTRHPLERVSPEALDMFWPQASATPGVPQKFAMIGVRAAGPPEALTYTVRFGPEPDAAYVAEYLGTIRPVSLAKTNQTTFLSLTYPDLLFACCMVFGGAYQRDWDLKNTWEQTYTGLRDGVMAEAARQRGEGAGWTPMLPAPLANQPRG